MINKSIKENYLENKVYYLCFRGFQCDRLLYFTFLPFFSSDKEKRNKINKYNAAAKDFLKQ